MEKYLSFDVANKSLAVCYTEYNSRWRSDCLEILSEDGQDIAALLEQLNRLRAVLLNIFRIRYLRVFDMLGNKKLRDCDAVYRAVRLRRTLEEVKEALPACPDRVLVEYQMSANDKSRIVSYQILYEFADIAELVRPTWKNALDLGAGGIKDYYAAYSSTYAANKKHTRDNFVHYLEQSGQSAVLKQVAKKNIDDCADAFMQMVAYIRFTPR